MNPAVVFFVALQLFFAAPSVEIWVNPSVTDTGDGSQLHPFRNLSTAISAYPGESVRIHLSAGFFRGPFSIDGRVQLDGKASSVLYAEGDQPVLEGRGAVSLAGISLQGGKTGIVMRGMLHLEGVHFSGQRQTVIDLIQGFAEIDNSELIASVSQVIGVQLHPSTHAHLRATRFEGPFRRAVNSKDAEVLVVGCDFGMSVEGIHHSNGLLTVQKSVFGEGRGAAMFVGEGAHARISSVQIFGHEYGLQSFSAELDVDDFISVRAVRAGIALVKTRARLTDLLLVDSGSYGAIQMVSSDAQVQHLRVHHAQIYALNILQSHLTLSNAELTDIGKASDQPAEAVSLRETQATLHSLTILRSEGLGVQVAQASRVSADDLTLIGCQEGGVVAETSSEFRGRSVWVSDSWGAAITVPDASSVMLSGFSSEKNRSGPLWLDCAQGAHASVSWLRGDASDSSFEACVKISPDWVWGADAKSKRGH